MSIFFLRLFCFLGIGLSSYALYVKKQVEKNKEYKSVCDINDRISCTKAVSSGYGSLFHIPNSVYGIIYYGVLFFASYIDWSFVIFLSFLSVLGSVYLGYILYTKVKSYCLVCTGIYMVNLFQFIFSIGAIV